MGWSSSPPEPSKVFTPEELAKKESTWYSAYNEPERWIKDMKEVYYSLIGEYEIEKNINLYRFELDETHRSNLMPGSARFMNVIINKALPQVILSQTMLDMHKKKSVIMQM